jgi:hypothetical protein
MHALLEACDLGRASLKDSRLGHGHFGKTGRAFRNGRLSRIQSWYEAATKFFYLGEGVRLAAVVNNGEHRSLFYAERVRLEIPLRIRSSGGRLCKQVLNGCGITERRERDVFAKVRPNGRSECVGSHSSIDCLEQVFGRRSGAIYGIKGSFLVRNLRDHPRFVSLLRRMNLS